MGMCTVAGYGWDAGVHARTMWTHSLGVLRAVATLEEASSHKSGHSKGRQQAQALPARPPRTGKSGPELYL